MIWMETTRKFERLGNWGDEGVWKYEFVSDVWDAVVWEMMRKCDISITRAYTKVMT